MKRKRFLLRTFITVTLLTLSFGHGLNTSQAEEFLDASTATAPVIANDETALKTRGEAKYSIEGMIFGTCSGGRDSHITP